MQFLFETSTSQRCKACIDDNYYFCQNSVGSSGQCCESSEDCQEVDVCSYHAPQESTGLRYWACPHSLEVCGVENLFVPSFNGAAGTIRPRNTEELTESAMCRYRLVFP